MKKRLEGLSLVACGLKLEIEIPLSSIGNIDPGYLETISLKSLSHMGLCSKDKND